MTLYVWYSPEWDMFDISTKNSGFLFKDPQGPHHLCYPYYDIPEIGVKRYAVSAFYLIGEF